MAGVVGLEIKVALSVCKNRVLGREIPRTASSALNVREVNVALTASTVTGAVRDCDSLNWRSLTEGAHDLEHDLVPQLANLLLPTMVDTPNHVQEGRITLSWYVRGEMVANVEEESTPTPNLFKYFHHILLL